LKNIAADDLTVFSGKNPTGNKPVQLLRKMNPTLTPSQFVTKTKQASVRQQQSRSMIRLLYL